MVANPLPLELLSLITGVFDSLGIHLILLALFAVAAIVVMRTAPKNLCIGVRIRSDQYDAMSCRKLRGRFNLWVVILAVLSGGAMRLSATSLPETNRDAIVYCGLQILFLLAILILFLLLRRSAAKTVERENLFSARETNKVVVDTSFHRKRKGISPFWLLLFPLVMGATFFAYEKYRPELYSGMFSAVFADLGFPSEVFSPFGVLNSGIVFLKNLAFYAQVMFTIWGIVSFIALAMARQSLDPSDPEGSLEEELRRRKKLQVVLLVSYLTAMVMLALLPFVFCLNVALPVYVCGLFPAYALSVLIVLYIFSRTGRSVASQNAGGKRTGWACFYYNEEDPTLFLWGRTGTGFVMNFARPAGKILGVGFCVLALGLLAYTVACRPMTDPNGFFPPRDAVIRNHASPGANLFFDAAYHSGDMITPDVIASILKPLSVKGKIELIRVNSHFPESWEVWQRTDDFRKKLENFLDGKITLEEFGENYTVETIAEEKVVFGRIRSITLDNGLQERRERGKFDDAQFPAQTTDDEYIYNSNSPFEWRQKFDGFQFETMGQLHGAAADDLVTVIVNKGLEPNGDDVGMVKPDFRQTFLDDAAIAACYHGRELFDVTGQEDYDGRHSATVLESREYFSLRRDSYGSSSRMLIDPHRGYVSPYGRVSHSWGVEAWRASDYFPFGQNKWVPRNYFTFKFRGRYDVAAKSVDIIRVTLDPDTVREGRTYREIWDEESQKRAYAPVD